MTKPKSVRPLTRNGVFDLLGASPTNPRWSWCGLRPDNKLAIFTLWQDEIEKNSNLLYRDNDPYNSRYGAGDQRRILDEVMYRGIPAYGLITVARDVTADNRKIKAVEADYLIPLKIFRRGGDIRGRHENKVLLTAITKALQPLKLSPKNGLNDLGSLLDVTAPPDRALTVGYTVIRDNKVRSRVISRAEGRCEFCDEPGFVMSNGQRYLEAHHIIALARQGRDTVSNVIALCPEHHRQAHFGTEARTLEGKFIKIVRRKQAGQKNRK